MTKAIELAGVVQLMGSWSSPWYGVIVMELLDTTLHTHVKQRGASDVEARDAMMCQIAMGLDGLHSRQIVHRDLHANNILVSYGDAGRVVAKISDLGGSAVVPKSGTHEGRAMLTWPCGAPHIRAPEVFFAAHSCSRFSRTWGPPRMIGPTTSHYGFPVDLWALGCLYTLIGTAKYPFLSQKVETEIVQQWGKLLGRVPESLSDRLKWCPDLVRLTNEAKGWAARSIKKTWPERALDLLKYDPELSSSLRGTASRTVT